MKLNSIVLSFAFAAALVGGHALATTTGSSGKPGAATVLTSSTGGIITSSSGNFGSGPVDAFQNNGKSRMLKQSKTFNIMYTFAEATKVNGYGICAGGSWFNVARGPKAWTIYGSNDYAPAGITGSTSESAADAAATWVELDSRSDETGWSDNEYRYYSFANSTKYATYKIDITANNGNDYTQWKYMEYCYEAACKLTVSGVPVQINEVSPTFGTHEMPTEETTFTSSESAETADTKTTCAGWKVYEMGDDDWVEDPSRGGTGSSFTWSEMPTVATKVEWQYATEYLVLNEGKNGSVSGTGWIADGTTATLTATPDEGFAFSRWLGDVSAEQATENPLALDVSKPLTVKAVFLPSGMTEYAQYVATDGNDANDGFSADSPKATVQAAVDALDLTAQGVVGTVYIAAGTYLQTKPIALSTPIRLVGAGTDDATGTVLKNKTGYTYGCDFRVLKMSHPQAAVYNLIASDGILGLGSGDNLGGAIYISAGVVSNCVIRNSYVRQASNPVPKGGGVYICGQDALVTHCVITNCRIEADASWIGDNCGAGAQITAGKLSNTLVSDCHTQSSTPTAAIVTGGIYASGGTVESCTVVGCKGSAHGGIYAQAAAAKIVNTVAIGNVKRIKVEGEVVETVSGLTGKAATYDTCVSDDEAPVNETCRTAAEGAFTDYAHGDFVPTVGGALHNTGKAVDNPPAVDLAGANRLVGNIDVGCYEQNASVTLVIVGDPENYGAVNVGWGTHTDLSGSVTITVQDRWDDPSGEMYALTDGWELFVRNGEEWASVESGEGASAQFTVPNTASRLVWYFTRYYKTTLDTVGSGTATGDEWVMEGDEFAPVVTADAGWHFAAWDGNIDETEVTNKTFTVSKPLYLTALFLPDGLNHPVLYVSKEGSDENDGFTRTTAKATVKNAVECVALYARLGGEVRVAAGEYREMSATKDLRVDYPIRVVGETGKPEDVVLDYVGFPGNYFILNDAGASLSNLTIENVTARGAVQGIAVRIEKNGGTVSNCVISACGGDGYSMKGAGVCSYSADGLVTHTKVLDCYVGDENVWGGNKAAGIHLDAGRAENCLIVGCYTQTAKPADDAQPRSIGGIYVQKGAKAENCTVVDCRGIRTGGIMAEAGAAVVNCAVIDCGYPGEKYAGSGEKDWTGNASAFVNCATDGAAAINDTCLIGLTAAAFKDYAEGDYTPQVSGLLFNTGAPVENPPATDLARKPRMQGSAIDIGCYEGSSGIVFSIK